MNFSGILADVTADCKRIMEQRKREPQEMARVTVRAAGIGISREFHSRTFGTAAAMEETISAFVRAVRRKGVEVIVERVNRYK